MLRLARPPVARAAALLLQRVVEGRGAAVDQQPTKIACRVVRRCAAQCAAAAFAGIRVRAACGERAAEFDTTFLPSAVVLAVAAMLTCLVDVRGRRPKPLVRIYYSFWPCRRPTLESECLLGQGSVRRQGLRVVGRRRRHYFIFSTAIFFRRSLRDRRKRYRTRHRSSSGWVGLRRVVYFLPRKLELLGGPSGTAQKCEFAGQEIHDSAEAHPT